jgi:uncharacterized protein YciI
MFYVAWLTIVDPELNREKRPDHLRYLAERFQRGEVAMAGPFTDGSGGLVVYQTDSLEHAYQLASQDPAVQSGARRLELKAWQVLDLAADSRPHDAKP